MLAPITYIPDYFPMSESGFDRLWNELPWERRPDAPRYECWFSTFHQSYTYGRGAGERTYDPKVWHTIPLLGQGFLNTDYDVFFHGCFVNGYEGSKDHLGWHADDDSHIDHTKPIAIISFGCEREIWFRANDKVDGVEKLLLENGSLTLMHAGMQQTHQHRIPKSPYQHSNRRISLTFRALLP
jgi:alkylated DNA repair dioxygenase AlkB